MSGDIGYIGFGTFRAHELPAGDQAGVAPAGRARFRFNRALGRVEVSSDAGAYAPLSTGGVSGTGTNEHLARWDGTGTTVIQDSQSRLSDDGRLAVFDDAAAEAAIPADQQLWARRQPADRDGAVISGRAIGEGRTGEYSAPVYRATRERVAASPDIWQSGYVYEPQAKVVGDIGVDVAFHAWPRSDAGTAGIAFQADATLGSGQEWAQVVQAYEQPLRMRAVSFATGPGKEVLIMSDGGIGAGNRGGDLQLEVAGGATNGVDETGTVVAQPKTQENMSATTGPIFEARAQPDVQPGVSFVRADWHGLEGPADWRRSGELTDQIAANQNDYDPNGDGLLHLSAIRVDNTSGAGVSLTGMAGRRVGRRFTLMNVSSDPAATVTLAHENVASAAENRFSLAAGTDIVIRQFGAVELVYDETSLRWRALVA